MYCREGRGPCRADTQCRRRHRPNRLSCSRAAHQTVRYASIGYPGAHRLPLGSGRRPAHAPFCVDTLANKAVEMCDTPAIPSSLVSHYTSSTASKGQLTGETRADFTLARPPQGRNSMADMPANNQVAVQTEQRKRDAQQLAKLGASPAALLLTSSPGPQVRNSGLTRKGK
jgi:hypothetical protein